MWLGGAGFYGYPYGYGWYGYAYGHPYGYAYSTVVLLQRPAAVAAAVPQGPVQWQYCRESQAFYPHVSECAAGWEVVTVAPAPVSKP